MSTFNFSCTHFLYLIARKRVLRRGFRRLISFKIVLQFFGLSCDGLLYSFCIFAAMILRIVSLSCTVLDSCASIYYDDCVVCFDDSSFGASMHLINGSGSYTSVTKLGSERLEWVKVMLTLFLQPSHRI